MGRIFTLKMFDSKSKIIALESGGFEAIMDHSHDFIELVYITKGQGLHIINGSKHPVQKGNMFIIPSNNIHALIPSLPENDLHWINCIFDKECLGSNFSESITEKIAHFDERDDIQLVMSKLIEEYKLKKANYQNIMKGLLMVVISIYQRQLLLENKQKNVTGNENNHQKLAYIQSAVNYIQSNYTNKLTLDDVAKAVNVSAGYLDRIFREERTISPMDCLNIYRIEQACKLLLSTDKSVYEICSDVGFNDVKFFYVIFKRKIGMTPKVYRKSKLNM